MALTAEQQREAFEAAGLRGDALEKALQGLANMRTTAAIEVRVNPDDERKYGDVTVFKVQGNGFRAPKLALKTGQIAEVLNGLVSAFAALDEKAYGTWAQSLVIPEETE